MEEMLQMQVCNDAIENENVTTAPIITEETACGVKDGAADCAHTTWENASTESADELCSGQLTEAVTEPRADTEKSSPGDMLQAEYQALAAAFPDELPFTHLADMPRLGAFLVLREKGLTPREAYLAIEGARVRDAQPLAHLRAAAPRVTVPTTPTLLSQETLAEWRRLFPHLSDREIGELYRRTATN